MADSALHSKLDRRVVSLEKKARVYLLPDVTALKMRVLTFVVLDLVRGRILKLKNRFEIGCVMIYENSSVTLSTDGGDGFAVKQEFLLSHKLL